jgi:DNA polymerase-3 subunit delta'
MLFKDVIGQAELKNHFIQEINGGKISHAQLFLGNAGFGGLPLALAFVQYLFCSNKTSSDSCGTCPSCNKVQALQHPDLHFSFPVVQAIEKKSDAFLKDWRKIITDSLYFNLNQWVNFIDDKGRKPIIGTEESNEIIKKLSLKSYEGGFKVMIIWMAEEMNPTCANKLLKILEEPPKDTLFILLSESQDLMLQTILSRTQIVKIPRIQLDDLSQKIAADFPISSSDATSIAAQSEGCFLTAKELLGSHEAADQNREFFIQMMRVCYKKDVLEMMSWAEQIAALGREKQKVFLKYALHMFRQSLLKNYTQNQLTRTSKEEDDFLSKFSRFITGNNIHSFMNYFNEAHYHIDRNANPKILFTELCFKSMRFIHFA